MDALGVDDPAVRDLRRYQLAMRLVGHRARTQTIYDLTGYTRHRLATLRRRWKLPDEVRHRGPSPKSVAAFFRSSRARSEATVVAALCHLTGAVRCRRLPVDGGQEFLPRDADRRLTTGERLCEAFEVYRACFPESEFEFDQVILLAKGLVKREALSLGHCAKCEGTILIDRLGTRRQTCSQCQSDIEDASTLHTGWRDAGVSDTEESPPSEGVQRTFFDEE